MINLLVTGFFHVWSNTNTSSNITPTVFYHPGPLTIIWWTTCIFVWISSPIPSSHFSPQICSYIVGWFMGLCKKPYMVDMSPISTRSPSTNNGSHSAPTCKWATNRNTLASWSSKYFNCLNTRSTTDTILDTAMSRETNYRWATNRKTLVSWLS